MEHVIRIPHKCHDFKADFVVPSGQDSQQGAGGDEGAAHDGQVRHAGGGNREKEAADLQTCCEKKLPSCGTAAVSLCVCVCVCFPIFLPLLPQIVSTFFL